MDRAELEAVFQRYGALVFRRAYVLLGNHAEAEEAAQEIFARAFKRAEQFGDGRRASAWLYQLATNYCLGVIRDSARRSEVFQEHVATSLAPLPGAPELGDMMLLRSKLRVAEEETARAAIYLYVDGMTPEESAEILGAAPSSLGKLSDELLFAVHENCPSELRLDRLYLGALREDEAKNIRSHVETCARCFARWELRDKGFAAFGEVDPEKLLVGIDKKLAIPGMRIPPAISQPMIVLSESKKNIPPEEASDKPRWLWPAIASAVLVIALAAVIYFSSPPKVDDAVKGSERIDRTK